MRGLARPQRCANQRRTLVAIAAASACSSQNELRVSETVERAVELTTASSTNEICSLRSF
eukprot:4539918-Pyramimonas_sp.AAC.1